MVSILLVDEDFDFTEALRLYLAENGFDVHSATSGEKCLEMLRTRSFDVVAVDQDLHGFTGLEIVKMIKTHHKVTDVLFMSGRNDVETAVKAVKSGAREYFRKPFAFDALLAEMTKIKKEREGVLNGDVIDEDDPRNRYRFENISSKNYRCQRIIDDARSFAQTDINILITGESGTGKGLLARTVHYNSPRWKNPFIEINSSAIPSSLLESELFGHEKGAFTDARETRQGFLEIAHNSTLFLDEISTMDFNMQSKLLKVLEDFKFYRVGGRKEIKVNVRLITATNTNLKELVEADRFREDLYYRLNVATIHLPPLRERREDMADLFMKFIREFNLLFNRNVEGITPGAKELLEKYPWPGNIRELRNLCEGIMITINDEMIDTKDLPATITDWKKQDFKSLKEVEEEHIKRTLEELKGNKSRAAEALGISRTTLITKVKKYGHNERST